MTTQREDKRLQRALRTIPLDAIALSIAADEAARDGLWCLVDGVLSFVPVHGRLGETALCDELVHAQVVRWVAAHPERVHSTKEAALAFVRLQLSP
jgi:hypothetical protein